MQLLLLRLAHPTNNRVVPSLLGVHHERERDGGKRYHHVAGLGEEAPITAGTDVDRARTEISRRPSVFIRVRQQAHEGDADVEAPLERPAVDPPHGVANRLREEEQVLHQRHLLLGGHALPVEREDEHGEHQVNAAVVDEHPAVARHAGRVQRRPLHLARPRAPHLLAEAHRED
uniref:Uncharacterized protein n=1 Tax=Triticum urartu TaxID=4572 RepID=A0A8R7TF86_TRIUA